MSKTNDLLLIIYDTLMKTIKVDYKKVDADKNTIKFDYQNNSYKLTLERIV